MLPYEQTGCLYNEDTQKHLFENNLEIDISKEARRLSSQWEKYQSTVLLLNT